MKKHGDKTPIPAAVELLTRNYEKILSEVENGDRAVGFLELQDAVQETALHVLTDKSVLEVKSDAEFVQFFIYRLRMIRFRIKQDYANEKKRYADHLQAAEEE